MDTKDVKVFYNKLVGETYKGDYEPNRWENSPVAKSGYTLTKEAIEQYVLPHLAEAKEYFELGPGPGTWTKVNAGGMPGSTIDLVDISRAMLENAKRNLAEVPNITYIESDFLDYKPTKQYDVFFSSRAIEYFPDKKPVVAKIAELLKSGGEAFLITKTPHYGRMKLLGQKITPFHENQISPKKLAALFTEAGCTVIDIRPAFVVVPGFRSAVLNLFVTRILRALPWNPFTESISESYLIHIKKT